MFIRSRSSATDVLLICSNLAIWGACVDLKRSLKLYSSVRNVDKGSFNNERRKGYAGGRGGVTCGWALVTAADCSCLNIHAASWEMADAIIIKARHGCCCKCPPFCWQQVVPEGNFTSQRVSQTIPAPAPPPPLPPCPPTTPPLKDRFIIKNVGVAASTYSLLISEYHAHGYF